MVMKHFFNFKRGETRADGKRFWRMRVNKKGQTPYPEWKTPEQYDALEKRQRKNTQDYYYDDPERSKAASKAYHNKHIKNPEYAKKIAARIRKRLYGITKDQWDVLYESQKHRCAICDCDLDELYLQNNKGVHLDHNHSTGAARGILCGPCNNMLGKLNEDIGIFKERIRKYRKAIKYLEKYDCEPIR